MNKLLLSLIIILLCFSSLIAEIDKNYTYNEILKNIRENPDSRELDKLYFYLAELSCDIDQNSPDKTISYYKQVVKYNREFEFKDVVYYNIAYYTERVISQYSEEEYDSNMLDQAIFYYEKIVNEHSESEYYSEAAWRLGEIYLNLGINNQDIQSLEKAGNYYELISMDDSSRLLIPALLGGIWVEFETHNYPNAINQSIKLLNMQNQSEDEFILNEAVEIICWILVNKEIQESTSDNELITGIESILRDLDSQYWKGKIIYQVGIELLENNYPEEAEQYFATALDRFPYSEFAPKFETANIDLYLRYPDRFGGIDASQKLISQKQEFILSKYAPESEWFIRNKGNNTYEAIAEIAKIIEIKESSVYQSFVDEPALDKIKELEGLSKAYFEFLSGNGESFSLKYQQMQERLVYCSQLLVNLYPSIQNLKVAINLHGKFTDTFPDHQNHKTYTRNIFLYAYNLAQKQNTQGVDSLFIEASRKYKSLLDHNHVSELSELLIKRAEYYFGLNEYIAAREDFLELTTFEAEASYKFISWEKLAEIAIYDNDLDEAEQYYRNAYDIAEGYRREIILDNIIAVVHQKAELLIMRERKYSAAILYAGFADELKYRKPYLSISYYMNAIELLNSLEDSNNLADVLNSSLIKIYNDLYASEVTDLEIKIKEIEEDFLNKTASEILPVYSSIRWKDNFMEGDKGVFELKKTCDEYKQDILNILDNENNPAYASSKALWYIAAIYDHAYLVIDQQVDKYLKIATEINNEDTFFDSIPKVVLKKRIRLEGTSIAKEFMLEAAKIYQNIFLYYYDDNRYTDLWVYRSLDRLVLWGIRNDTGRNEIIDDTRLVSEKSLNNDMIEKEYDSIYQKFLMEDYHSSQAGFELFIDKYPGHILTYDALYYLGECHYNLGDLEEALGIFEKVLEYNKEKTPDALIRIGHYYNKQDNREKAFEYWERLVIEYPESNLADIIKITMIKLKNEN